ncbi:hypothetical protein MMPV_008204 [Pyropia vietnamensis]
MASVAAQPPHRHPSAPSRPLTPRGAALVAAAAAAHVLLTLLSPLVPYLLDALGAAAAAAARRAVARRAAAAAAAAAATAAVGVATVAVASASAVQADGEDGRPLPSSSPLSSSLSVQSSSVLKTLTRRGGSSARSSTGAMGGEVDGLRTPAAPPAADPNVAAVSAGVPHRAATLASASVSPASPPPPTDAEIAAVAHALLLPASVRGLPTPPPRGAAAPYHLPSLLAAGGGGGSGGGGDGSGGTGEGGPPRVVAVSFCGCAWLLPYHVGAAASLADGGLLGPDTVYMGTSCGALLAAALAVGVSPREVAAAITARAASVSTGGAGGGGVLGPAGRMSALVRAALDAVLPADAAAAATGRLGVAVSRVAAAGVVPVVVTGWASRSELLDCLLASCFIPVYYEGVPRRRRGALWLDGGATNNLPLRAEMGGGGDPAGRDTLTVSPYVGGGTISPAPGGREPPFAGTHRLFPAGAEGLAAAEARGRADAAAVVAAIAAAAAADPEGERARPRGVVPPDEIVWW